MTLQSSDFFHLMRTAYKTGLLQKWAAISDEAMESVVKELGIGSFDLIDHMDQSDPAEAEARLARIGPWLKWIARPLLMKALSRLLDVPFVRRKAVAFVKDENRKRLAPIAERSLRGEGSL